MIDSKLLNDIEKYCKLNEIEDVKSLINKMLQRGFTIEKYGELPTPAIPKEKPKKISKPKVNKYKVSIRVEEEKIIEETIIVKEEIKEYTDKDIYGE